MERALLRGAVAEEREDDLPLPPDLGSPGDARYLSAADRLARAGDQRDLLAGRIRAQLWAAAFEGGQIDPAQARDLVSAAGALVGELEAVAQGTDG